MAALIIALLLVFALLETALPKPDIAALRLKVSAGQPHSLSDKINREAALAQWVKLQHFY
jgi:hypothetical protein